MSKLVEEWRPIRGFEELYEVSDWGNVASLNYRRTGKWHLLTPTPDGRGYLEVTLCKDEKETRAKVHLLIWDTFVGENRAGLEVNHMDEDKNNCAVWNLNLMTAKQNANHGTRNERIAKANSKPVVAKDPVTLKVLYEFPSIAEAGRNGFYGSNISLCCNGKQKTHKGLIWQWA